VLEALLVFSWATSHAPALALGIDAPLMRLGARAASVCARAAEVADVQMEVAAVCRATGAAESAAEWEAGCAAVQALSHSS
jgi:hypothetical protein